VIIDLYIAPQHRVKLKVLTKVVKKMLTFVGECS